MMSPSENELKALVKVITILAVLLASLWGADSTGLLTLAG